MRKLVLPVALLAVLSGCNAKAPGAGAEPTQAATSAAAADNGTPLTSVQEIMLGRIVPTSDQIWNASGVTFEGGKEVKLAPKNDAEWAALAEAAANIRIGAAALQKPGLPLVPPGADLKPKNPGELSKVEILALVDKDRPGFARHAKALEDVARDLEAAIAARNPDKMMDLGGTMDEACESCHKTFWYPDK